MATSTQRVLMILLMMNVIISLSIAVYDSPRVIDYDIFGEQIDISEGYGNALEDEQTRITPDNLQEEGGFGNTIRMGWIVFKLFMRGLVKLPFSKAMTGGALDQIGYIMLIILRGAFILLGVVEFINWRINRKAT